MVCKRFGLAGCDANFPLVPVAGFETVPERVHPREAVRVFAFPIAFSAFFKIDAGDCAMAVRLKMATIRKA